MYIYVEEAGEYDEYEMTFEFDTLDEVLDRYQVRTSSFLNVYEFKARLSYVDLDAAVSSRETTRKAAIEMAKSKLTPEELELLGIK